MSSDTPLPVASRWDWKRLLSRYGPPAGAFAASWAVYAFVILDNGYAFTPENFTKWDAVLYQSVAQKGYELFPCAGASMWGGQAWCGNTGWFPLYPLATRLVAIVFQSLPLSATLVSSACFFALLCLLWIRVCGSVFSAENLLLLLLAAFFPGQLYFLAPYPLTLFLLCAVLAAGNLLAERYALAGVFGGLAALSYSSAAALLIVFGVYLLIAHRRWPLQRQLRPLLLTCGLTALGYVVFLAIMKITVGRWDANFLVLGKYGIGLNDPLATFLEKTVAMFRGEYRAREEFQGFQHLLVTGLALGLVVVTMRDSRKPPTPLETLAAIYASVFLLFPMVVGSGVLMWRAEALLMPTVVLMRRLSRPVQWMFLATFILLSGEFTLQYYKNWLP